MRGIRHKILEQIKKKKDAFPEDDVHMRLKEVIHPCDGGSSTFLFLLTLERRFRPCACLCCSFGLSLEGEVEGRWETSRVCCRSDLFGVHGSARPI